MRVRVASSQTIRVLTEELETLDKSGTPSFLPGSVHETTLPISRISINKDRILQ